VIFLIEYNRREGKLVTFRSFEGRQREQAAALRLQLELDLHRCNIDHEVVLLEAESEQALRVTHRRYFEDLRQLLQSAGARSAGSR
jgi:hypothetical protein